MQRGRKRVSTSSVRSTKPTEIQGPVEQSTIKVHIWFEHVISEWKQIRLGEIYIG